jgi:ketosteroid isomerase-like protein
VGEIVVVNTDLAAEFAAALGRKDAVALKALLRPDVDFRGLTPGRAWGSTSADELVDEILLGAWFEPSDVIDGVIAIETAAVGRRARVGYRFHVTNADGEHLVDQQAYIEPDGGQIGWLRMMCAGFQPLE